MTTQLFKSNELNAKNLKQDLKEIGVKVLRARQNGNGVLLTVCLLSTDKANEYLNSKNIGVYANIVNALEAGNKNHADYGTLFQWVKPINA
jgi:hypothetical protein|tara:strand:+ start:131 stop:403 length:273 start_codon:yes stop_codon:yes gene_type:complete